MATFGQSASTGAILEEFSSPCDGSSITIRSGTYTVGENVYQGANLAAATARGEVVSYASGVLTVMNSSGNFAINTNIIGDSSAASYTLTSYDPLAFPNDDNSQNSEIETYADSGVVDFTESNPFGEF